MLKFENGIRMVNTIVLSIILFTSIIEPVHALETCETHDPINDIITVKCNTNFVKLVTEINDPTKVSLNNGELLLNTTISTGGYTTFSINYNENISWVKITNGNGIIIGGRAEIDGIRITSWDQINNTIVNQNDSNSIPRGYIYFQSSNGGRITNSDIGYLGYRGEKSYTVGISFYDSYDMIISNSRFHDNYFAFYSANSYNITIDNNEYYHNILYAIDPHTDSHDFRITNNHVHNNYKFGIIFSLRCYNFLIENNTIHDNNEGKTGISYGIFASRVSNDNIIRNNTIYNETIGIDLSQSSKNEVYDNKISNTDIGIYIRSGIEGISKDNNIHDNKIIKSKINIDILNSRGNRITNNTNSIIATMIVNFKNEEKYSTSYNYYRIKSFLNKIFSVNYSDNITNIVNNSIELRTNYSKDSITIEPETRKNSTVIITFDDGSRTVYDNAFPILKANNQKAVSYIITGRTDRSDRNVPRKYMNWSETKLLYDSGWDISSHGVSHIDLRSANDLQLNFELNKSQSNLISKGFVRSAKFFAYPFGGVDNRVVNATKANGYLAARISGEQKLLQKINLSENNNSLYEMNPFEVFNNTPIIDIKNAINETIKQNNTIILEYHIITPDENAAQATQTSLSNFKIISDYIASRKADISIITMSEYYDSLMLQNKNVSK